MTRQTDRQTDRQTTDRQTDTHPDSKIPILRPNDGSTFYPQSKVECTGYVTGNKLRWLPKECNDDENK